MARQAARRHFKDRLWGPVTKKLDWVPKVFRAHAFNILKSKFFTYSHFKSYNGKLSVPNLAHESKLFKGHSSLAYLACAAFYTSVSGVINANNKVSEMSELKTRHFCFGKLHPILKYSVSPRPLCTRGPIIV